MVSSLVTCESPDFKTLGSRLIYQNHTARLMKIIVIYYSNFAEVSLSREVYFSIY